MQFMHRQREEKRSLRISSAFREKYGKFRENAKMSIPWKSNRSFLESVDLDILGGQIPQILKEFVLDVLGQRLSQIIDVGLGVSEILQKLEALGETSENGEFAVEGILAEEQVKHCLVFDTTGFPVRIRHRDLVQIWNTRKFIFIFLLLENGFIKKFFRENVRIFHAC